MLFIPFGRIIYNVAERYEQISVADLRQLEKLSVKFKKIQNDIAFLKNCQTFQVFPKFLSFRIPHSSPTDLKTIRKRLLRSAIHRRVTEKKKTELKLKDITISIKMSYPGSIGALLHDVSITILLSKTRST